MMEHEGHVVEGRVSRGTTSPKASVSQSVKGGEPPPRPCTGAGHEVMWVRWPMEDATAPQVDGVMPSAGRPRSEQSVASSLWFTTEDRGAAQVRGAVPLSYHC